MTGKAQSTDQGHIVDFDLQVISNELWHDGAEAIAINGQRLIATSTIRAAGNAILVDLAPLSEPYTIQAIGPSTMADALRKSAVGRFYELLATSYGVQFVGALDRRARSRCPPRSEPQLTYATPPRPRRGTPSPSPLRTSAARPRASPGSTDSPAPSATIPGGP